MSNAKLFSTPLFKKQNIAFVMSSRLGDSLLSMIVVNNLVRNGFNVTVFGDYIYQLKDWFPWAKIYAKPNVAQVKQILSNFDILLHAFKADIINGADQWHAGVKILEQSSYNWLRIPMVDIQVEFCKHELLLENVVRDNNIKIPTVLTYRKYPQRIIIHPSSYELFKNWLPQRFLQLARKLHASGYQPEFIVSASERRNFAWVLKENFALPEFASLDAVARYIYESGWFIGNDSGLGHLAANLGIKTLTLGMRSRVMQRWRPTWTKGIVLVPPKWLITRPLKERFWKYFISVRQVLQAFEQLIKIG